MKVKVDDVKIGRMENPYNKIEDVTKETLKSNRRFVIVEFRKRKDTKYYNFHKCLAFLVKDVKNAECPGYPACAVEYFDSFEEGKKKIEAHYKKIGYTPKYPIEKYVSKEERRDNH